MVAPCCSLRFRLDYAIFLLHAFSGSETEPRCEIGHARRYEEELLFDRGFGGDDLLRILRHCFMQFQIGMDLGLALVKGIVAHSYAWWCSFPPSL